VAVLQEVDKIYIDALRRWDLYDKVWQGGGGGGAPGGGGGGGGGGLWRRRECQAERVLPEGKLWRQAFELNKSFLFIIGVRGGRFGGLYTR